MVAQRKLLGFWFFHFPILLCTLLISFDFFFLTIYNCLTTFFHLLFLSLPFSNHSFLSFFHFSFSLFLFFSNFFKINVASDDGLVIIWTLHRIVSEGEKLLGSDEIVYEEVFTYSFFYLLAIRYMLSFSFISSCFILLFKFCSITSEKIVKMQKVLLLFFFNTLFFTNTSITISYHVP